MWDLLHYYEAYQRLNSIERRWRDTVDAGDIAVILRKQADFLSHLKSESEKETPENLVDILFNAERCFARKAYTDTLARFWRIYEGILYYRLREEYGIEPRNIASGKKLSLSEADKELRTLQDQPFLNVLKTSLKAMRKSSQQEIKVEGLLEELREKRNSSVVAHGMKPVSEEDAANSITAAKALLAKMISSGDELLKEYPLNKPQVGALLDFLAAS
jgi:hypothetical protein